MQTLYQDFRCGARMQLKKPGFASVAVIAVTLALACIYGVTSYAVERRTLVGPRNAPR